MTPSDLSRNPRYIMVIHTHLPAPPLSAFIDTLWYTEGGATEGGRERALPTGTVELVIDLGPERIRLYDPDDPRCFQTFPSAIVCGAHSRYFVIDTARHAVMGVHFKPGGASPFLRLPAGEITDRHVALEDVGGPDAATLRPRLLEVSTPPARFTILEEWLRHRSDRLERHRAVAWAVREFSRVPHLRTVADVTSDVGLSARRFIDVFRHDVGLNPKVFCRIQRFQAALRQTAAGKDVEWTRVALDCGYFDQAHFNRDFRAFTGLNPTTYLHQRTHHVNHVALLD